MNWAGAANVRLQWSGWRTFVLNPRRPNRARVEMLVPVLKVVTARAGLTEHLLRPGKSIQ